MKTCFGYVRVSCKRQGDGASLDAQRSAIQQFADRNDIEIIEWFEEQQTAATSGRPLFNRMLNALRRGKAQGVVMHKIDRSARNFADWAKIGELADQGVSIHFATESLDFCSRGGRLAANIQMAIAEDYIRNLKEEVRKGQIECLKQGLYPFNAPIGYMNNGKGKLKTPDPARAPLITQAFKLYASGRYSIQTLRREINNRGLRNRRGMPISKGCLENILSNPFYAGIIHIRRTGEVYQGKHHPLISSTLFQTVQDRKARKYIKKTTRHQFVFRGLFSCKQCHTSMIPERQKGLVYYRCHTQVCPANCIREEPLHEAVRKGLSIVTASEDHWREFAKQFTAWLKKRNSKDELTQTRLLIAQLDARKERLTDALIDQVISKETYNSKLRSLLLKRAHLEKRLKSAKKNRQNSQDIWTFLELVKSLLIHYELGDDAAKREIVEMAFSNRSVRDKRIHLEPSNWLQVIENTLSAFSCPQSRPSSRRQRDAIELHFKKLHALPSSSKFNDMIGSISKKTR